MLIFEQFRLVIQFLVGSAALIRVAAFFLVWIVLWLPIAIPLAIGLKWQPPNPFTTAQKLSLVLSLYALAPFLLWGAVWLERITFSDFTFSDYGLTWNLAFLVSLGVGLGLGILGVAALFGLEIGIGWAIWQPINWHQAINALLPTFLLGLLVSLVEESVFRGFLLNQLQQDYAPWTAAIGSSIIFALLHLVWDRGEAVPQLPGLWLMGIVLVLARWVDGGSLGIATGLHTGWILAMATLDTAEAVHYTGRCPEWVTGWSGKPLAGIMGLLLLLGTAAVLWGFSLVSLNQ